MPPVHKNKVREKILDGLVSASEKYSLWSNNDPFYFAPEYFLNIEIGRMIRGIKGHNPGITFERNILDTLKTAKGLRQGRPSEKLKVKGRYDIVVWRVDGEYPRFVVEVKRDVWGYSIIKNDILRVATAFENKKTKMQCGFVAFTTFGFEKEYKNGKRKDAQTVIEERLNTIDKKIKDMGFKCERFDKKLNYVDGGDGAGRAVVLEFERAT